MCRGFKCGLASRLQTSKVVSTVVASLSKAPSQYASLSCAVQSLPPKAGAMVCPSTAPSLQQAPPGQVQAGGAAGRGDGGGGLGEGGGGGGLGKGGGGAVA